MTRPVLLTWELGAGRGHAIHLAAIGRELWRLGFDPHYAVQRVDTMQDAVDAAAAIYQGPIWPGLRPGFASNPQPHAGLGDSLAALGFHDAGIVEALVGEWDALFARVRPLAVVADFAPASLMVARGRVPSVAVGNGYTLPPATMREFPILRPDAEARSHDEAQTLQAVNAALARAGRRGLDVLPRVFAADRHCVACFAELDPNAEWRDTAYTAPFVAGWDRTQARTAAEIFVYLPESIGRYPALADAIERIAGEERAVRVFVPNLDPATATSLTAAGARVETSPLPHSEVARRSSLIVSHGGSGTAAFALVAGIPQVVIALDTEKLMTGRAVERLGVGRCVRIGRGNPLEGALLAQVVCEAADDATLAAEAKRIAPGFAARLGREPAVIVAEHVAEIARAPG